MSKEEITDLIKGHISKEMKIDKEDIRSSDSFFELGLDSISCIFLLDRLEKFLGRELNPIFFWDYPTIDTLAEFLEKEVRST